MVALAKRANGLVPIALSLGAFSLQSIVSMMEKPRNLSFIFRCVILRFELLIQIDRVLARSRVALGKIHHFLLEVRERNILPSSLFSSLLHEKIFCLLRFHRSHSSTATRNPTDTGGYLATQLAPRPSLHHGR